MTNNIPDLTIERNDDGTITLEQNWSGNVDRVAVHLVHVRHLAELVGLIYAPRIEGGTLNVSPPCLDEVKRENDRLRRQHLRLREHMLSLQIDFAQHADHRHADLSTEMWRINAVVDLMDLVCADFEDDYSQEPTPVAPKQGGHIQCDPPSTRVRTEYGPSDRNAITPAAQSGTQCPVEQKAAKAQSRTECGIGKVEQLEIPA